MESKQPRLVKLLDEDDETTPDRAAYASFAMQVLDLKSVNLIWLEKNGKHSLYLYDPSIKKEEVQKLVEQGCYRDFTPTEERLKHFNLFKALKERYESVAQLLKEALRKLE